MPEVQAQIAQLEEELSLTAAFVKVTQRSGDHRAAIGAIEEARSRVAQSERVMIREFARPRKHKIHAAMAGIAAVMMLASGAFAGFRAFAPSAPGAKDRLIQAASAKLTQAASTTNATQKAALVGQVHESLSALSEAALQDGAVHEDVKSLLEQELQILRNVPGSSALVKQITTLAKKANVKIPEEKQPAPAPPPAPEPKTQEAPSNPTTPSQ